MINKKTTWLLTSSGPRVNHQQFLSAIFIRSLYPQFLTNAMSFLKNTKVSSSKFHVVRILLNAHI